MHPGFVAIKHDDKSESMTTTIHADLHNTNLNNAALRIRLDELTWFLETKCYLYWLDMDLSFNPISDEGIYQSLVPFLQRWGKCIIRLRLTGTAISGRALRALCAFVRQGGVDEIHCSRINNPDQDSVLELLKAAKESRYPRQGVTPLMLRLDQNNLPPKEILDKAEGVGVRCKVLTSDVELNEMMQRRKAAKQKPLLVATVPQTVDLPLFHDQQMPRNPEKEPLRGIPRGVQGTPFQSAPGPLRTTTWGPDTAPTTPERIPKTLESLLTPPPVLPAHAKGRPQAPAVPPPLYRLLEAPPSDAREALLEKAMQQTVQSKSAPPARSAFMPGQQGSSCRPSSANVRAFSPLDHIQPPPQAHSNRSPAPRQLPPQPKFRPEKPLDQDVVRLQLDQLREQLDKQSAPKVLSKPTMPRSWLAPKPSTARAALPPPCPALPPPPSTPNEENGWHDVSKSEWQEKGWNDVSKSEWQADWTGKSDWSQWQDDWKGKSNWSQWQDWKDNKEEAEWKDWKDKEEAEWKDDSKGKNGKNDWSQQQDDSKGKNGKNDWSQQQDDSKGKNGKNDWSQQQGWKDSEKEPETRKMSSQQMRSKSRSRSPSSREKRSAFQDKSDDPEDERKDDEREADDKDDKEWEQFYIRVMKMDMDEKRRRHSKVFDDKDEKVVVEEPVELPLEKTEIQEADDTVEPMELPEEPEPEEPADSEPEPSLPPRPALPALPPPPPPAPAVRAGPLSRVPRGLQPKGSQPPPEPKALPKVLPKAPKRGSASYKKDEAAKKEEEEESWIWPREDPRSKASRIAYADRFMTRAAAKARTMAKLTNFQCHCRGSLSDLGENKARTNAKSRLFQIGLVLLPFAWPP
ncbi:unnamed protein product, partial [Effrenium voratum]